jgi:hypothetical protein
MTGTVGGGTDNGGHATHLWGRKRRKGTRIGEKEVEKEVEKKETRNARREKHKNVDRNE